MKEVSQITQNIQKGEEINSHKCEEGGGPVSICINTYLVKEEKKLELSLSKLSHSRIKLIQRFDQLSCLQSLHQTFN